MSHNATSSCQSDDLQTIFTKAAEKALADFAFQESCCPDQFVGYIKDLKEKQFTRIDAFDWVNINHDAPRVILILESPHVAEYKDISNIVPANGTTGINICRYIANILTSQDCYSDVCIKDAGLIIMNAIQYQCSLGVAPRYFRDRIFSEVWCNKDTIENFKSRLRLYLQRPDKCIVINACTSHTDKDRKNKVSEAICDIGICPICIRHPSSWVKPKYREIQICVNFQRR